MPVSLSVPGDRLPLPTTASTRNPLYFGRFGTGLLSLHSRIRRSSLSSFHSVVPAGRAIANHLAISIGTHSIPRRLLKSGEGVVNDFAAEVCGDLVATVV